VLGDDDGDTVVDGVGVVVFVGVTVGVGVLHKFEVGYGDDDGSTVDDGDEGNFVIFVITPASDVGLAGVVTSIFKCTGV